MSFLKELLSENDNVVGFPTKKRIRQVRDDRLKQRGMRYDEITGLEIPDVPHTTEFHVVDEYEKSMGIFDTEAEAYKAIPRIEMKSGKRGLLVIPF